VHRWTSPAYGRREGKRRLLSEGLEEGSVASLELSDGVMEQVEAMAKELRKISGKILVLVEGVGKLTEAVVGLEKKEVERRDKGTEMETIQKVDWEGVTEIVEEESESEEEEEKKKRWKGRWRRGDGGSRIGINIVVESTSFFFFFFLVIKKHKE
jgi:hypothetical protein